MNPRRMRGSVVKCVLAAAVAVVPGLVARGARADSGDALQCVNAYEQGQRQRKAGQLAAARNTFVLCASDACPSALHADCSRWLDEVETATPSAVFRVIDDAGNELDDVALRIDGGNAMLLNGRAVSFDPGPHLLQFSRAGFAPAEKSVTFAEAEKLSRQTVTLVRTPATQPATVAPPVFETAPKQEAPPPQVASEPVWWPLWLGVGVGAAGLASFGYFGLSARADDRKLESCTPNCSSADADSVRQQYLIANISLGVGAAGLLTAAAWALFGLSSDEPPGTVGKVKLTVGPISSVRFEL